MNYENPMPIKEISNVIPYRLTFIHDTSCCDFCLNPTGPVFSHYTDIDELCGFISCKSCIEIGSAAVVNWKSNLTYGRAEHLLNRLVKIYRHDFVKQKKSDTTGVPSDTPNFSHIQGGWMVTSHIEIFNNVEYVKCKMLLTHFIKKCRVDDLILLNGSS